jgi:hypothetical protein
MNSRVKIFIGVAWLFAALAVRAQTITTLRTNGPATNRINLILFAEGYRTNQQAQFTNDAAATVSNLLATAPYADYSNYFNAFAIGVASTNAGANHSATGNTNLSYFNASYNSLGLTQLITIPPNDRDATYSKGKGKIEALLTNVSLYTNQLALATNLLAQLNSSNRFLILIVNDSLYGGSGQPPTTNDAFPLAVTSLGSAGTVPARDIIVHESGHTFAGLADEYTNAFAGFTPVERPNATTNTVLANIPWKAWIDEGIDVPTPTGMGLESFVGVWAGAEYQITNWFRPRYDCKMNHLGVGFCEICSEAIVKGCHQRLRFLENLFPATNNPVLTTTQTVAFSFTRLQPSTHSLLVQWFTNGVAANSQTNATFTFNPAQFTNGNHTVRAAVWETTTLVRTDPNLILSNSQTWNLTLGVTSLQLTNARWRTNGQFTCAVAGTALHGLVMQATTNLAVTNGWLNLSTNALTNGVFLFTNTPGALPRRYYRALGL